MTNEYKIEKVSLQPYSLKLKKPWNINDSVVDYRRGFYLACTISGETFIGEASPLPGLHLESIEDIEQRLLEVSKILVTTKTPLVFKISEDLFGNFPSLTNEPPSITSAIEQIFWLFFNRQSPTRMANYTTIYTGRNRNYQGYKAIKWKVRGKPMLVWDELNAFSKTWPNTLIRIDGNRSIDPEELPKFCEVLSKFKNIDYIEEPCSNLRVAVDSTRNAGIKLAADESLWLKESLTKEAQVIVAKPQRLGGVSKVLQIKIKYPDKRLVLSHCFESPKTVAFLSKLGHAISPTENHGIYTQEFFATPKGAS